jgi:hypothetical protein
VEERIIELVAKGHSIGESLEVKIEAGKDHSIGAESEITIQLSGKDETSAFELSLSKTDGFEKDGILLDPPEIDHGVSTFVLKAVPIGKPGPSILRIIVKGELYSATLGIQEIDLNIKPPTMDIELIGGPLVVSAEERSLLPIKLKMPGHSKFKGEVSLEMLDQKGRNMDLQGGDPKHVSFKDSRTIEFNILPSTIPQGSYSIRVEVREKDSTFSRVLPDAVEIINEGDWEIKDVPDIKEEGKDRDIRLISFKFDPSEVSPGSVTEMDLEIERSEALESPLDLSLSLGRKKIMELKIVQGLEHIKDRIKVPSDLRSGEVTAVLTISSPEKILLREVRPRSLIIKGTSHLNFRMATPSDISDIDRKDNEEYLFPGEYIRSRRKFGQIEIWALNSGRHLYIYEGKVVLGTEWDDDLTDEVLIRLLAIELAERYIQPDLHRRLRRGINEAISIGSFSLGDPSKYGNEEVELDKLVKDLPECAVGPISGSVIKRSAGRNGHIMSRSKMKDLRSDPIPSIVNDIGIILSLENFKQDLKDHYEDIIREFRSAKERPDRAATATAHAICMIGVRSALDKMVHEGKMTEGIAELIFHLITSSLIRIECLTTWTDPALGSWDDLRIERQRMLKKEISSLFDLLDDLINYSRSINRRFSSYRSNMNVRRRLALISRIDKGLSDWTFGGEGGETWVGKRTIQMGSEAGGMDIEASIKLPSLSWNLVSPPSERDGSLFILPVEKVPPNGKYEMELKITAPSNPPSSQEGLIYLIPKENKMEVEE